MTSTKTLAPNSFAWPALDGGSDRLDPEELLQALDQEMRRLLDRYAEGPAEFWTMAAYHLGWVDLDESPAIPGKRIRPLLTLLSASAAGGEWRDALPLAAAVELVHSFSLVHDDVQDEGELRRGRPSVWAKWGVGQAINAGDNLFALAHLAVRHATAIPAEKRLEAMGLLDESCVRLGEGQYLDMTFEDRTDPSLADYMDMIEGKTATLLGLAAELGGLAANADAGVRASLRQFGIRLGLAFQVRDDILGTWGDSGLTGKTASDIVRRKKTLPVVLGLIASPQLRRMFDSESAPDASRARQIMEEQGVRSACYRALERHVAAALGHLRAAQLSGAASQLLHRLAFSLLPTEADTRPTSFDHPRNERDGSGYGPSIANAKGKRNGGQVSAGLGAIPEPPTAAVGTRGVTGAH